MSVFHSEQDIKLNQIGVRYSPPTLVVTYIIRSTAKLHRRSMPIRNLTKFSRIPVIAKDIRTNTKHSMFLDMISLAQLEKMLAILQNHMKGLTLEESLHKIRTEQEVDLNTVDDFTLQHKKELMNEVFEKNQVRPGDPNFIYDKQIDFSVSEKKQSGWDESDEEMETHSERVTSYQATPVSNTNVSGGNNLTPLTFTQESKIENDQAISPSTIQWGERQRRERLDIAFNPNSDPKNEDTKSHNIRNGENNAFVNMGTGNHITQVNSNNDNLGNEICSSINDNAENLTSSIFNKDKEVEKEMINAEDNVGKQDMVKYNVIQGIVENVSSEADRTEQQNSKVTSNGNDETLSKKTTGMAEQQNDECIVEQNNGVVNRIGSESSRVVGESYSDSIEVDVKEEGDGSEHVDSDSLGNMECSNGEKDDGADDHDDRDADESKINNDMDIEKLQSRPTSSSSVAQRLFDENKAAQDDKIIETVKVDSDDNETEIRKDIPVEEYKADSNDAEVKIAEDIDSGEGDRNAWKSAVNKYDGNRVGIDGDPAKCTGIMAEDNIVETGNVKGNLSKVDDSESSDVDVIKGKENESNDDVEDIVEEDCDVEEVIEDEEVEAGNVDAPMLLTLENDGDAGGDTAGAVDAVNAVNDSWSASPDPPLSPATDTPHQPPRISLLTLVKDGEKSGAAGTQDMVDPEVAEEQSSSDDRKQDVTKSEIEGVPISPIDDEDFEW